MKRFSRYLLDNIYKFIIAFLVGIFLASAISKREWMLKHRDFNVYLSIAEIMVGIILIGIAITLLRWLLLKMRKLEIIYAKYGAPGGYRSITATLRSFISNNKIRHKLNNGIVGGEDPAPQVPKHAIIDYKYGWVKSRTVVNELDEIILPPEK